MASSPRPKVNVYSYGYSGGAVLTFMILAAAGGGALMYFLPSISMNAYNSLNKALGGIPDSFNNAIKNTGTTKPTSTPVTSTPKKTVGPSASLRKKTTSAYTYYRSNSYYTRYF